MIVFLSLCFMLGCEKEKKVKEQKETSLEYSPIGHTVTVSRNGYTYTCTNMGNFHVKCVGPPLEDSAAPTQKKEH